MKAMDKLKEKASNNKRILLFLSGISLMGLLFGSIFITIITKQDQALVQTYITDFINNIQNGKLNYLDTFKNTFISNISFTTIIWTLGISIIGIPIILFMYFTKTFMIGFSISSFVLKYKAKGILYAIIYIFPHHLIHLIIFTLLVIYAIKFSYYLGNSIFKKKSIYFKNLINPYLRILFFIICVLVFTSLYETFAVPYFLKQILFIIK